MCYRAQFGRSSLKSVVRDTEQPKLESAGAQPLLDGAVADPQKQAPSLYFLPRQIWWFCVKGCMHKYKETPKSGER